MSSPAPQTFLGRWGWILPPQRALLGGTPQLGGGDTRVPLPRDNVYRVSLEPSGAAEMRYHRVSAGGLGGFGGCQGDLGGLRGVSGGAVGFSPSPHWFPPPQKLTWRSNQHDISICRMKGKHEVQPGEARAPWGTPGGDWAPSVTVSHQQGHPVPSLVSPPAPWQQLYLIYWLLG